MNTDEIAFVFVAIIGAYSIFVPILTHPPMNPNSVFAFFFLGLYVVCLISIRILVELMANNEHSNCQSPKVTGEVEE